MTGGDLALALGFIVLCAGVGLGLGWLISERILRMTTDDLELREIITLAPPGGVLRPDDYPWLAAVQVYLKGGDGGPSAAGTPGGAGQTRMMTYRRDQLPAELNIRVGRGAKGVDGGADGQDGFVMIELWARKGTA